MSRCLRPHELHIPRWIASSELQSHVDEFVRCSLEQGYSKGTLHAYRNAGAHFAHWLAVHRIALSRLDEALIERFVSHHLPVCRCGPLRQRTSHTVRAGLKLLLRFLRRQGVVRAARALDPPAVAQELSAFAYFQEHVCGLTQVTREVSRLRVRAFLLDCFGNQPIRITALTSKEATSFIARYTANCTPRSRGVICRSIRGYLHFKGLTDPYAETLCEQLPKVAMWRLASGPKSLSRAESKAVLAACRGSDPVSRRDYAILHCLSDLGLRTVEVARLRIDDFDWAAGTVRIRGKGHRVDVMPVPIPTGEAIVAYIPGALGRMGPCMLAKRVRDSGIRMASSHLPKRVLRGIGRATSSRSARRL